MSAIYKARPAAKSVFETATQYLNYFLSTWLLLPLWQSWSDFGRLAASVLLKNSNQSILITNILPEIFANCQAHRHYNDWLLKWFSSPSNSAKITVTLELRQNPSREVGPKLCWWREDHHTSTIDNILTLQMMVLQSVPSEELQDDLEDDVDFITDTRSDQSDHSSETSTSAAELLKFEQSSGDHCNVVMIQTQQHVDHITKQILPHLQSLVSPAMDGPLTRTSGVEELESTLIFTPTSNHQLSSSSFGQPSGLLPPVCTVKPDAAITRGQAHQKILRHYTITNLVLSVSKRLHLCGASALASFVGLAGFLGSHESVINPREWRAGHILCHANMCFPILNGVFPWRMMDKGINIVAPGENPMTRSTLKRIK
ncbi:hypothetical protein FIBSPDRAFT_887193 [Athelia psychrophila]|uniref:Uncharacterized protein n=1 Tax=Athelia psychrophila TaxID=1759441 RepID=A0A166Q374_9AGAM|nr:hypothetical protein FIBSPDRAFT_887193 [Fibularhizoctonia sp. CBS 109695]